MPYKVFVPELSARFDVGEDETIVEAATAQGIAFPFSCHSGTCGTCKSRLVSGTVTLLDHYSRFTLTDAERKAGLILACCSIPNSDCKISPLPQSPIPARRMTGTVVGVRNATHDIKIVTVEVPGGMQFLAGQYADVTFDQLPARSYSMANKPGDPLLEFHIRLAPQGAVTPYVHSILAAGARIALNGPLGTSYLRDNHRGPVLAIAGGSGLGPVKSIIDTLLTRPQPPAIDFYFGVRDEGDLYYAKHFYELAAKGLITFVPVLSASSSATGRRTGFLAEVIKTDFKDLIGFKAYLAGPPIMVETCLTAITALGLSLDECHADAF